MRPATTHGLLDNGRDITMELPSAGIPSLALGGGGDSGFKSVAYKTALPQESSNNSDEIEFTMADAQRGRSLFLFGPDSKLRMVLANVRGCRVPGMHSHACTAKACMCGTQVAVVLHVLACARPASEPS